MGEHVGVLHINRSSPNPTSAPWGSLRLYVDMRLHMYVYMYNYIYIYTYVYMCLPGGSSSTSRPSSSRSGPPPNSATGVPALSPFLLLTCTYVHVPHVYVCMYAGMYVYMYVCTYIHMHVCTCLLFT